MQNTIAERIRDRSRNITVRDEIKLDGFRMAVRIEMVASTADAGLASTGAHRGPGGGLSIGWRDEAVGLGSAFLSCSAYLSTSFPAGGCSISGTPFAPMKTATNRAGASPSFRPRCQ